MGLRFRVGVPGPYVGPVPSFVDLLRTGCRQPALGPRYVVVGSSHGWSFTYWSVAFGGARGVQELVTCPSGVTGNLPSRGRRGSRGREAFGTAPSVPLVTRWTGRRIEWLVRQAHGRARPLKTVAQLAARWGITPRWLRKRLHRWRQSGVVSRLHPRRRPPSPLLTKEEKRQIEEEHRRSPRGATKMWRAHYGPPGFLGGSLR